MIRRLVEQSYFGHSASATPELVRFWLRELRPAVRAALSAHLDDVSETLAAEEREERRKDRKYWAPLKRELEEFRLGRRRQ